jgi:hypothetical protein
MLHDGGTPAERCTIVWTIFAAPLLNWFLLMILYVRALRVAITFNKAIDDLLFATLQQADRAEAAQLTNYLASLHQLGKLYIAPFGLKLTAANLLQALIATGTMVAQAVLRLLK